jgi:hypothetical protein
VKGGWEGAWGGLAHLLRYSQPHGDGGLALGGGLLQDSIEAAVLDKLGDEVLAPLPPATTMRAVGPR